MQIPVWLIWLFATMLAIMPMSILLMARSDKPDERCASLEEEVASGVLVINEMEALVIARAIAEAQMRERWGRDLSRID